MNLKAALIVTFTQFAEFATGDGLTPWSWNTQWTFERFAPRALEHYRANRQARAPFNFIWANVIYVPLQALAVAVLPLIVWLRRDRRIASLAAFLFFELVVNAIICGALSNPHDRYQSRLVWLAPFVVAIAALGWRRHPSIVFRVTAPEVREQAAALVYRKRHPY